VGNSSLLVGFSACLQLPNHVLAFFFVALGLHTGDQANATDPISTKGDRTTLT